MNGLPRQEQRIEPTAPWWNKRAGWLYAAIATGELPDHGAQNERYPLVHEIVGTLELPGGRFVAADPYVMDEDPEPFVQHLTAEVAKVVAVRAVVGEGHERVAALVLHAGSSPITDWMMATIAGQDVFTLDEECFFGYGVDAGTGSFGSPDAMRVTGQVLRADEGMLDDPVSTALFEDGIGTRSAVVVAPEPGATPVAVCSSGWGDGCYPTWLGVDETGAVVVAVTDFTLTQDPYAVPFPTEPPAEQEPAAHPMSFLRRWFGG